MAICRYFQQGRCKHGSELLPFVCRVLKSPIDINDSISFSDKCWNEHVGPGTAVTENRFGVLQGAGGSSGGGFGGTSGQNQSRYPNELPYGLNKDFIIADLTRERPQWILSAYGPTREVPAQLMGGYPREQSFEEVRLLHYQAAASGNPANVQQVAQEMQALASQAEQQIQTILSDIDGAVRFIEAAKDNHPNRWDICKGSSGMAGQAAMQPQTIMGQPSSTTGQPASGTAFGQQSALGSASAFGRPSQLVVGRPTFGQPSQLAGASPTFGQPSQLGNASAFGQPSHIGTASTSFGQPSQLGSGSAFGQPPQHGNGSAFGQPSQLGGGPAFGQSSQLGGGLAFGKPSQLGAGPAFSQPPQVGGSGVFGQPSSAPQANNVFSGPSTQVNPNPFAAIPTGPAAGAFGRPSQFQINTSTPTHQVSPDAPFRSTPADFSGTWQKDETGNPVPFPIEVANPYPQDAKLVHPDLRTYSTRDPSNRLLTWKSRPVIYVDNKPCFERSRDKKMERISYPDGPPPYNRDTELPESMYDEKTKEAYLFVRDKGYFKDNWMPNLPPRREWCKWDF
ncbi:hypothetical protein GP486_000215 [Trichoglossum hirsutum]|uniref:C3H1-type domain-containing protein n=1 Tax=Trichoglossum hirsutum TaxID=265104 RepID=A0A9P8LJC8_9PEZI|nr:hypothetical protein GP486_000215 [Trichoglossum hirsutum]